MAAIAGAAARLVIGLCALHILPYSIFIATDQTEGAAVQWVHDSGTCQLMSARHRKLAGPLPPGASAKVEASGAANIIRLTPPVAGSITHMPLNYAHTTDHKITNTVLVQPTRGIRRNNGLLDAWPIGQLHRSQLPD